MALKKSEYAMISNFFRNVLNPIIVFYLARHYGASFEIFFWIWVIINWFFSISYLLFVIYYLSKPGRVLSIEVLGYHQKLHL